MDRLAIEINGAGLLVADSSNVLVSEPGYAIVEDSGTIVGAQAYQQARLLPAKARSGFWSGLSVGAAAAESRAELAFEHLKQVWNQAGRPGSGAVLIVPGGYDAEQLGLVLGIAHECGIRVEAMIDSAVAASALRYDGCQLFYVDASLRTVSVTRLDQSGAAAVDAYQMSQATGLGEFTDEMVRAIARVFVLDTRIDPLHTAETEQSLYVGLPVWLEALHVQGAATAEIQHAGKRVAVELTLERIRGASLRLMREIARMIAEMRTPSMPAVVQLHNRLATLPGLRSELERIEGLVLSELAPGFPAISALGRLQDIAAGSDEVRLLRRLPFVGKAQLPTAAPVAAARPKDVVVPTHVVFEGIGYRIADKPVEIVSAEAMRPGNGVRTVVVGERGSSGVHCVLAIEGGALTLRPGGQIRIRVNGEPVDTGRRLKAGDILQIGEPAAELRIVALEG